MNIYKKIFIYIIIILFFFIIIYLFNSSEKVSKVDLEDSNLDIIKEGNDGNLIEKINYETSLCKDIALYEIGKYDYFQDFDSLTEVLILYYYFQAIGLEEYVYLKGFDIPGKFYIDKEYNFTKSLVKKDCSYIDKNIDEDGNILCNIYMSGNLKDLKNFSFSDGEDGSFLYDFFLALYEGKALKGEEYNFDTIYNFYDYEKNIEFTFKDIGKLPTKEYIYLQKNGKDSYLKELDKQFINECENLIKEYNEN